MTWEGVQAQAGVCASPLAKGIQQNLRRFEVVAEHPVVGARDEIALMILACACLLFHAAAVACPVAWHGHVHARVHAVILQGLTQAHALCGVITTPTLTCIQLMRAQLRTRTSASSDQSKAWPADGPIACLIAQQECTSPNLNAVVQ